MSPRYFAVVPAAGSGKRMGGELPKQYMRLLERTVLEWSVGALLRQARIEKIIVVIASDDAHFAKTDLAHDARLKTVIGGRERVDSVRAGLGALMNDAKHDDWVLVHDAARPCLTDADLNALLNNLQDDPVGGLLATPLSDTIKQSNEQQRATATLPRENVWRALTPQMFRFGLLRRALDETQKNRTAVTDEAMAVERLGGMPRLIAGRADNIKITRPEDLELAASILRALTTSRPALG